MQMNVHFLCLLLLLMASCKQTSQVSPLLHEALHIQDSAIHIGMEVEDILAEQLSNDTSAIRGDSLSKIKIEFEDWKKSMIAIPGMEHDHDHEGHDHGHHHHHHYVGQDGAHLTPEELKNVQESWKVAIQNIKSRLMDMR